MASSSGHSTATTPMFDVSSRVKAVKLLAFKREFELLKMKDNESIKIYYGRLMNIVNQMRLLRETFEDHKEQRVQMRGYEVVDGGTQAFSKTHRTDILPKKSFNSGKSIILSKNKAIVPANRQTFSPCSYCKRTNHAENDCWFKGKTLLHYDHCKKNEGKDDDKLLFMATRDEHTSRRDTWLIDSGCTRHMTKFLSIFSSIDSSSKPKIKLGNGDIVEAKGRGTVTVNTSKGTKIITNIFYIPKLDQNLLSVAQMLRNGYEVSFKEIFCFITDSHGLAIAKIEMEGNSFYLKLDAIEGHVLSAKVDESIVWH
uniref:Retrovirus-related Pol polyprotein from transposon TNT 1-94-like beta-barrel domain-containing protein n=1 Tax=Salix viminalis TaxID=40686 RepID=A0A6N2MMV6_SALVM